MILRFRRWGILAAILFLLAQSEAIAATHQKLALSWSELDGVVTGKVVDLILPNGTAIKGTVVRRASDALVVDIKKTSNRSVYTTGQASIPRSSVTTLQIKERHGPWRAIGMAAGAAAGGTAGALVYRRFNNEANAESGGAAAAGIVGAAVAAGFFAGRSADTRVTTISVRPTEDEASSSDAGSATRPPASHQENCRLGQTAGSL